jgi:hypothetical protein
MTQIVLSILANWFSRTEANLQKHLSVPRDHLYDVERQLSRQLKSHFRSQRRSA